VALLKPDKISNLLFFHRADAGITGDAMQDPTSLAVTQWDDLSGNEYHLTSAGTGDHEWTENDGPGGRPTLLLDQDTDSWFEYSTLSHASSDFTAYLLFQGIDLGNAANRYVFDTETGRMLLVVSRSSVAYKDEIHAYNDSDGWDSDNNNLAWNYRSGATQLAANWNIAVWRMDGTNNKRDYNVNGTAIDNTESWTNKAIGGTATPKFGASYNESASSQMVVAVCEWGMFSKALSDAEVDQIVGYVANDYGLTSILPADHPYKFTAPTTPDISTVDEDMGTLTVCFAELDLKEADTDNIKPDDYSTNLYRITMTDRPGLRHKGSGGTRDMENLVKSWGRVRQTGHFGRAQAGLSDFSVELWNTKASGQLSNSKLTLPSGSPSLDPEPQGDIQRLSELFQFYPVVGAPFRVNLAHFPDSDDTIISESSDAVVETIFEGRVHGIRVSQETVTLDATSQLKTLETLMPGRVIDDPPKSGAQVGGRAPIYYGVYRFEAADYAPLSHRSYSLLNARPPVVHTTPLQMVATDSTDIVYIYNDYTGANAPFTTHQDPTHTPFFFIYHKSEGILSQILSSTSDGELNDTTSTAEMKFETNEYIKATAYIPFTEVSDVAGAVGNYSLSVDKDVKTSTAISLSASSTFIRYKIPGVSSLGTITIAADSIEPWVMLEDTGEASHFGILSFGLTKDAPGTTPAFSVFPTSTAGTINHTNMTTDGLYFSKTTGGTIPSADYLLGDTEQPLLNWRWHYSSAGPSSTDEVFCFFNPTTTSTGDTALIIAAGLKVDYVINSSRGFGTVEIPVTIRRRNPNPDAQDGEYTEWRGPSIFMRFVRVPQEYGEIWVSPDSGVLDTATGTITGTNDKELENPAEICAHLIAAWGNGINTPTDAVEISPPSDEEFGSFRRAAARLDNWTDENNTGDSWDILFRGIDEAPLREYLDRICSESPLMITQDSTSGRHYAFAWPEASTDVAADDGDRYLDSSDSIVYFHPNIHGGSHYGRGYALADFEVGLSPAESIYNRFRILYRLFPPTGEFTTYQFVSESDSLVYDGGGSGLPDTTSSAMETLCADSQERYGITREYLVTATSIWKHNTAKSYLDYLIRRLTNQRMIVTATAFKEGAGLRPGNIVRFSDDCNLIIPRIDFQNSPGAETGWSSEDFMVLQVDIDCSSGTPLVTFAAEHILYS
jgi:hypothetical protein